jgi:hypothetical protein
MKRAIPMVGNPGSEFLEMNYFTPLGEARELARR